MAVGAVVEGFVFNVFENSQKTSLVAQVVKNHPAVQETQGRSPGQGDPLQKERQPTPVILPGESCGQRSLAWGCRRVT